MNMSPKREYGSFIYLFIFVRCPFLIKVRIYNKNLVLIKQIAGSQVGSHYGGSVVGSDLNGDG